MSQLRDAVIDRVRRLLNDMGPGSYRWSDIVLGKYVDDAVEMLRKRRPEAFLGVNDVISEWPVNTSWDADLAKYAAAQALLEDSADTTNIKMAEAYLSAWMI